VDPIVVIVSLVGIVASLVGIILGWVLTQVAERWRWQREDRTRFATTRRELYARYLIETTVIFEDARGAVTAGYVGQVGQTVSVLIGAMRKLRQSQLEITLVAGQRGVVDASADLLEITAAAIRLATGHPGDLPTLDARWQAASTAYEAAARADLGLS
jgi:hypothetical protein